MAQESKTTFQVVWSSLADAKPVFKEVTAHCLESAIALARKVADSAGFVLAQILAADGRVLANVARGCIRMTP